MDKVTKLSDESLNTIKDLRTKAERAALAADQAVSAAKIADLEYRLQVQATFLANGLLPSCSVDIETGTITWPAEPVVEAVGEGVA
jgi:hypothetical protein